MPDVIRSVCPHDCPDTCAMLVTVENGRATRIAGDPSHPITQGFLCTKVSKYLERTYHPDRLLYPQIRAGAKGDGKFRRATWDEALSLIAEKLNAIRRSADGPQAILPYSYGGTLGTLQSEAMAARFFNAIGASQLDRTICASAGAEALNMTYGTRMGTDTERVGDAKLILLWGTNTLTSNPHLWPFIRKAKANGATTICIDPLRTRTAAACDEHIAIRPGTDAALALAIMHVLFRDGLHDRAYLEQMTLGWEKLRDRALAEYSPERVAPICRLDVHTIEHLAHRYGTIQPAFIRLNYGLQRHAGGGNAVRAISLLPAVTGSWNYPAGGCQLSTSATFGFHSARIQREDLIPPGTRTINMSRLGEALNEIDDPPVRALIVYNSNPAAVAPERDRVLAGLRRDDLFTVVLEHFQTDTADYADVLLPATTQLEHEDIHKAYGHLYLMYNQPAIAPLGESLPNAEIFRRLGAAIGLDEPAVRATDEEILREVLATAAPVVSKISLEELRERGSIRIDLPAPHVPWAAGAHVPTPSGRIEIDSSAAAKLGIDPVASYVPPYESEERDPELARRYPLALISPPAHAFLNSSFVNVASLRRSAGKPTLEIHADDAERRGIAEGERVRIHNDRGAFTAEAVITDRVRPGVVSAPSVWWGKLTEDGTNANQTTSQAVTDIGGGATFYDNLVEVSRTASGIRHKTPDAGCRMPDAGPNDSRLPLRYTSPRVTEFGIPLLLVAIVYVVMLVLNERMNLFGDHFSSPLLKVLAYIWLAVFLGFITVAIVSSSMIHPTERELAAMPFYSLFTLHAALIIFLAGWWFLAGRPPLARFLNIRFDGNSLLTGLAVGVGGWLLTITLALAIALVLQATGVVPKDVQPPAMIGWIATLPVWKKCVLVFSAMTVEEAFFRGWLQKRIGLIASTLFFALAHAGYGQPFLLIGVTLISLVIGFTFYRTKNIIPGVIAHGVFDAVQLFVIIPIAFKAAGLGM